MASDGEDYTNAVSEIPPTPGEITTPVKTTIGNEKEKREKDLQEKNKEKNKSDANTTTTDTAMEIETNDLAIRFIIKHKAKKNINIPELLQAFIEEAINFDKTAKFYNHNNGEIAAKNFPFGEDEFKQQFNGGNTNTPGIHNERLFNGNTTCTWMKIKTKLSFQELRRQTQAWLKPNKIYLDLIKNDYFGPRDAIGQLFNIPTECTHRDNLIEKINATVNPTKKRDTTSNHQRRK